MFRTWLLIVVTAVLLHGADARRKLWQLDLAQFVNGRKDLSAVVWGISFSPDESKLAIGFGPLPGTGAAAPQHIVIVSVGSPSMALREFDVGLENYIVTTFAWAPSGTALVVGDALARPVMLTIGGEPPCTLPDLAQFGGFLSDDRMVITMNDAEIRILRRDCSLLNSWKTAGYTRVRDTSPDKDLIATLSPSADGSSTIELVSGTREVIQRWSRNAEEKPSGGLHFADHGRMLCSGYGSSKEPYRGDHIGCWDTQSGAITARDTNVTLGDNLIREGGGLLAITDYDITIRTGRLWHALDMGGITILPRRRVIWDARTGKEIASWTRPTIKAHSATALSQNGRYYAEGDSGSLSVYSLQP